MDWQQQLEVSQEYSLYAQEVLGKPPAWILRTGGTVVFIVMVSILALSWLVKYPEIITAKTTITTPIPPVNIIARESGKLHWVRGLDNEVLSKGETVAIIDSPANPSAISELKQWLKDFQVRGSMAAVPKPLQFTDDLRLGEIQNQYAKFQRNLNEYRFFLQWNPLEQKMSAANQQRKKLDDLLEQYRRQRKTLEKEKRLLESDLNRFKTLFNKSLVSANTIDEKQLALLKNKREYQQLLTETTGSQLEIAKLEREMIETKLSDEKTRQDYYLQLEESYLSLIEAIDEWEQRYLLKSPIRGRLSLFKFWSNDQFVKTGDEVAAVVPEHHQLIIAKVKMPLENSGKVKVGQKVLIKLTGYPYQEYGQLESRVESISLLPREGLYSVEARLPDPLVTSFDKTLKFDQEMQGSAEIITEDLRLIERVFYQIVKILKA